MTPRIRRLALIAHVVSSVGWIGAVASFLALAIVGLTRQDVVMVRAAYFGMYLIGWYVIVPFAIASFLTGIISSLGTAWGLFRHYWVVAKLVMTIPATILLVLHLQPVGTIGGAAQATLSGANFDGLKVQLVAEAAGAVVVLLVATILSVYKPAGMTRRGWRQQHEQRAASQA